MTVNFKIEIVIAGQANVGIGLSMFLCIAEKACCFSDPWTHLQYFRLS
jgi:hypothetical protein